MKCTRAFLMFSFSLVLLSEVAYGKCNGFSKLRGGTGFHNAPITVLFDAKKFLGPGTKSGGIEFVCDEDTIAFRELSPTDGNHCFYFGSIDSNWNVSGIYVCSAPHLGGPHKFQGYLTSK